MILSVGAKHALHGADVDELFQDLRIRLWKGRTTSEEIEALPTSYIYQAAMSAAVDMLRKRRRAAARVVDEGDDIVTNVPQRAGADDDTRLRDLQAQLEVALQRLIPNRRMVVRMSLAGYDRREIGERLGWSEAKVRNLLSRGMDDLRSLLATNYPEGRPHA